MQKIFGDMYIGVKRTIETDHFSEWQILENAQMDALEFEELLYRMFAEKLLRIK